MSRNRNIKKIRNKLNKKIEKEKQLLKDVFNGTTIGTVINTSDPQEMGRVQVYCPSLGDNIDDNIENLPWCIYLTPFGGTIGFGNRGPEETEIDGSTSYGIWGLPKVGAQVLVTCMEGNPDYRIWLGCIFGQHLPHTMPHGRFFDKLDESGILSSNLDGPLDSTEKPIEPTYSNLEQAFGPKDGNHEWKSRGMDNQVSTVDNIRISETKSKLSDDTNKGYSKDRHSPEYAVNDSTIYSMTSPGFHSLSMDDKKENCRIKLRTTSGHMILLDDTNERIYLATAKGENWIELDQAGNIDMFTSGNFSVHAEKDINFTSNKSIKMYAKEAIHIKSEDQIKLQADKDLNIKSNKNLNIKSDLNTKMHVGVDFLLQADKKLDILAGDNLRLNSNATLYTKSSLNTYINGAQTFLNSGVSGNVITPISTLFVETAFIPSKIPEHEPWGRIATKPVMINNESQYTTNIIAGLGINTSSILELSYDSINVGKIERGITLIRGTNWKR